MGPVDSEVDLTYILTHARRRSSRIFDFSTKEKSDHLVVSRNRVLRTEGRAAREIAKRSVLDRHVKGLQREC